MHCQKKTKFALNAIREAKAVFQNLHKISFKKGKEGLRKKMLTRPPCFDGIVQTCEGVTQLLNEEITDRKIQYIITGKLNQDPIENLFSRFRQKGGSNRNPTAKLLRTIFRSCLVNSLTKLPKTKNCEDEEGTFLELPEETSTTTSCYGLSTASGPQPAKKNVELSVSDIERIAGPSWASCSTAGAPQLLTSEDSEIEEIKLEECSLAYFAGYLAKKSTEKSNCDLCKINLIK